MKPARLLALPAAVCVAGLLSSCGVNISGADTQHVQFVQQQARERRAQLHFRQKQAELPPRTPGTININGEHPGSITARAAADFNGSVTGITANFNVTGDSAASFANLCRGEVDIVETTVPITRAQLHACAQNGVRLAAPLQVASDAVVVATRNGSDVGGDCVGVPVVRSIFRRGSTSRTGPRSASTTCPSRPPG